MRLDHTFLRQTFRLSGRFTPCTRPAEFRTKSPGSVNCTASSASLAPTTAHLATTPFSGMYSCHLVRPLATGTSGVSRRYASMWILSVLREARQREAQTVSRMRFRPIRPSPSTAIFSGSMSFSYFLVNPGLSSASTSGLSRSAFTSTRAGISSRRAGARPANLSVSDFTASYPIRNASCTNIA